MKNDNTQKNKNREKKETIVAEVVARLQKSKALVFTNYQGMTHRQMEDFKKNLKAVNADLAVTKNTLLKIGLTQTGYKDAMEGQDLDQPTATLYSFEDPIPALKELAKSIKTLKLPLIKFGIVDGRVINESDVIKLSALPPKDVLIAQFVGAMKSPLYGLHRALQWNMTKLVMTLKAIETQKTS